MSWDDFETPTVDEIKSHPNADALIKSHVKKYVCPECDTVNLVTFSDGWNNNYECSTHGCDHEFKYVG